MNRTISIAPVRKTVIVQATPQKAFEVFTAGVDRWWPKSHGIGAAPIQESIGARYRFAPVAPGALTRRRYGGSVEAGIEDDEG